MKYKNTILTITLGALSIFSYEVYAQEQGSMSKREIAHMDSVEAESKKVIQAQKTKDENTMADFRRDKKQTKAKAKDAQRIERDANAAARESRVALRAERRAQQSRKDANKQAEKAEKARDKSDKN